MTMTSYVYLRRPTIYVEIHNLVDYTFLKVFIGYIVFAFCVVIKFKFSFQTSSTCARSVTVLLYYGITFVDFNLIFFLK